MEDGSTIMREPRRDNLPATIRDSSDRCAWFKATGWDDAQEDMVGEYILLFDRDCGICSALGRWIHAADLRRRIRLRTLQSSWDLLPGLPEDVVFSAFHVISPGGQVATGGDAVPVLIEALPMGAGLGRILRGSHGLMVQVHAFYRFLTRFRAQLVCGMEPRGTWEGSGR
jgi:predicted DCC family thiol-disulfide oxidoreductase YuxK